MSFELSRVCSSFNRGKWDIHMFGWDDGVPAKRVNTITDYYYFRQDKIGLISQFNKQDFADEPPVKTIDGYDALKVHYTSIKEKNNLVRLNEEYTYEADVSPEFKHVLANRLKWSDFRHVVYFDIETTVDENNNSANTPEKALCPITAISLYSTRFKKYFTFTWHPNVTEELTSPEIKEKDDKVYIFCRDEVDVLLGFFEFVSLYSVDVISGWWSGGFDLPYIINRSIRLGLDQYKKLSPIGEVVCYKKAETWKIYIDGLDHVDMLDAIKDLGYKFPNYKLSTVAKHVLKNPDLEKLTHVTWRDWMDNYKGFLQYSIKDVEVLMEIAKSLQVFELYTNIQKLTNLTKLQLVLSKSFVVDHYILSENFGKVVFPTRVTRPKQQYMGATVLDPTEPGLHIGVATLDYASLYPTMIMAFNLSPETFICSEKHCRDIGTPIEDVIARLNEEGIAYVDTKHDADLFGGRYLFYAQSHKVGILPQILKTMFVERKAIKKQMKKRGLDPELKVALDKKQMAYKLIMNSTYGAMGFNYFRLYTPEVADSITFFARKALLFGVKYFNQIGTKVLYGDTDSIFIDKAGLTHDELQKIVDDYNDALKTTFVTHFNSGAMEDFKLLELEYEKDLERIYFSAAKKRYYGIHEETREKYITGMNIVRKDTPEFLKVALNDLAERAVMGTLTIEDVLDLYIHIKEQPLEMIGLSQTFSKPFGEYKTQSQHVKATQWTNSILGTKITYKDVVLLFYVKSLCEPDVKPRLRNIAVCLKEEDLNLVDKNKHLFLIDYDLFFEKQVINQLQEFEYIPAIKELVKEYYRLVSESGWA